MAKTGCSTSMQDLLVLRSGGKIDQVASMWRGNQAASAIRESRSNGQEVQQGQQRVEGVAPGQGSGRPAPFALGGGRQLAGGDRAGRLQLEEQFAESARLEVGIRANLRGLLNGS
jgi:hypothetical protein